ncbi:Dps family protein [Tenacibaculum sp. UWU-22]|uniref:Dps family protein n=1 Tax=Tenacibaculum sp. UWU-22 TaxID=3234187 RepID=UPI0034DB68AC
METKKNEKIADLLNILLADESVLYLKTRNYHWNVKGPNFYSLHNLFEVQYEELAVMIDDIAEHIRQLGHYAVATMGDYLKSTNLLETAHGNLDEKTMLQNLVNDHNTIIRILTNDLGKSEDLKDTITVDFITTLTEKHQKMAWMLQASIA